MNNELEQVKTTGASKKFKIILEIFRYLGIALFVFWTINVVWGIIDTYNTSQSIPDDQIDLTGLGYAILLVLSMIVYGVVVVINLTGLIMSLVNKTHTKRKFNIVYFLLANAVVIITFIIETLVVQNITK